MTDTDLRNLRSFVSVANAPWPLSHTSVSLMVPKQGIMVAPNKQTRSSTVHMLAAARTTLERAGQP
jgi:hypothetical protein